eukprot:jgi/Chlat1/3442/Chrsp23S03767
MQLCRQQHARLLWLRPQGSYYSGSSSCLGVRASTARGAQGASRSCHRAASAVGAAHSLSSRRAGAAATTLTAAWPVSAAQRRRRQSQIVQPHCCMESQMAGTTSGSEEAAMPMEALLVESALNVNGAVRSPKSVSHSQDDWRSALENVVPCVVVLRVTATRSFDTESAGSSYATGFVVDKERGLLLTNRHVVKPGPVVAEAVFLNREEIPVHPLYRDPVHDFGFMRFDPKALQFMEVGEVPLAPEGAHVGLEIRVVGNDSGEKISILSGTIARLDRDAPFYRSDGYNDFNTFYLQAASGTKGGSSGSPVIDARGHAVALNAGSKTKSSSAFFLPLDRVVRALKMLQSSWSPTTGFPAPQIARGTLQVTFSHKGFDETRRLGLQTQTEELVRKASSVKGTEETGMLVVDSVVPNGPAASVLEPGDVLIKMQDQVMTQFLDLEATFDDHVGKQIEVVFQRGGKEIQASLTVQDLHSITPDTFLEVCGGVIHALSYQQARNFSAHCGLVYVAEAGYMLSRAAVPKQAMIHSLAGIPTPNLDAFIEALAQQAQGSRVPLEFTTTSNRHHKKSVLVTVDWRWYASPRLYNRDDSSGLWWSREAFAAAPPESPCVMSPAQHRSPPPELEDAFSLMSTAGDMADSKPWSAPEEEEAAAVQADTAQDIVEKSLALVEVHIPPVALVDGVHGKSFDGTGLVVHQAEDLGLVLVDRNTVPTSAADIMLSFAAYPIDVPAEIVFLHPIHNFAILAFQPCMMPANARAAIRAAVLLPEPVLKQGDAVHLVGLMRNLRATSRRSLVTNAHASVNIPSASVPRYRAVNEEVVVLDTDFGSTFSGVLSDDTGRVRALWGSYSKQDRLSSGDTKDTEFVCGLSMDAIAPTVQALISSRENVIRGITGRMPRSTHVSVLDVELHPLPLSKARDFGLSESWIKMLSAKDPRRRQVLQVRGCVAGSPAADVLRPGDLLLQANGRPIICFRDVSRTCDNAFSNKDNGGEPGVLHLTVLRERRETAVAVKITELDGRGTSRMIHWAGALLQAPHRAVMELGYLPPEGYGVFVSRWYSGSPVHRHGLYALQWITEINGHKTADLDTFVSLAQSLPDGAFVRVKTVNLTGKSKVLTVKLDLHYWPMWELYLDPTTCTWQRRELSAGAQLSPLSGTTSSVPGDGVTPLSLQS